MRPQNGTRGYCAKYIQLIQSVHGQTYVPCTQCIYWSIVYWRNFLPIPTGSAGCNYLHQFPRLSFCGLIYIQLIHLWPEPFKSSMLIVILCHCACRSSALRRVESPSAGFDLAKKRGDQVAAAATSPRGTPSGPGSSSSGLLQLPEEENVLLGLDLLSGLSPSQSRQVQLRQVFFKRIVS